MRGFESMKDTKRYDEIRQLHNEGYLQKGKVELERYAKATSISSMSESGQIDELEYRSLLLERILHRDNMNKAYKRVVQNKGKHGVDKMTVGQLLRYLKENGKELVNTIQIGEYKPQPIRRVEIPKDSGEKRKLGIPTVVDRVIQQSILQVLNEIYDDEFSEYSYGFRPNRSAKQAVMQCRDYIEQGYKWCVDLDLEKFFDNVNHDKLLRTLSEKINDGRVLSLIRRYLQSGVMVGNKLTPTEKGTPQGGNISPILSNIILDKLDKELENRGLRFVRYADDVMIFVKSRKSADRVLISVTKFIEDNLNLKVNKEKSKIDRPWKLKFLGFSFYNSKNGVGITTHKKSIGRLKSKLKLLTGRSKSMNITDRLKKLRQTIVGWINYFNIADMKNHMLNLDKWLRRRIRMIFWKQWKKVKTKFKNLMKLGIPRDKAWEYANTRKGYWRISNSPILSRSLNNEVLAKLGFVSLYKTYSKIH